MRNRRILLTLITVLTLSVVQGLAQVSVQATNNANANITLGIAIVKNQDLQFGDLFSPAAAGTVTVSELGVRTSSAGIVLVGGTVSNASFTVSETGPGDKRFWTLVPTTITITRSGGGATMTVTNFTANINMGSCMSTGAVPPGPRGQCPKSDPAYTLTIGARLNVAGGQMQGAYTGTFPVTVNRM